MIKQLVFVTESDIDWMYINSTIRAIYDVRDIRLDHVSMNGKNNYNKKNVVTKINKAKAGIDGESVVVYCYDTDDINANPNDAKFDKEITKHCKNNGYGLVWFCRDIEEVFLETRVEQNEKLREAKNYVRKIKSNPYQKTNICSTNKTNKNSNLLVVLKILTPNIN